jgi:hypothetical protein
VPDFRKSPAPQISRDLPAHLPSRILPKLLPRHDSPIPLGMIFPVIFAAVYLAHGSLLRLPYYWDEAGYYIPAAFDFFRTGSLIPTTTLSNAHPPLPSIYLALWWKLSGFSPLVTRTAMCFVAALALLAVYRLAVVTTGRAAIAFATTLLTALYPVWFAQSTLAHADLFAAAATLWGLAFTLAADREGPDAELSIATPRERLKSWAAVLCFSLAVLSKETAIITPLALALWELWQLWQVQLENRGQLDPASAREHINAAIRNVLAAIPLALWYAYHYHRTGFILGNPEFLRYNATATLSPLRILLALGHRLLHITAHLNMFVPVACTLAAMMLPPRQEADGTPRPRIAPLDQERIYFVLVANLVFFSIMGGALLTRYLLPLYPLVLLLCVNTLRRRVPYWPALIALSTAAFVTGIFVNPPYRFAPEDNLAYADTIVLQQHAIAYVMHHFPHPDVLTAWPATDEFTKPELGYILHPVPVTAIDNFSLPQIQRLQTNEATSSPATPPAPIYTTALIFSTKYDPSNLPVRLGLGSEAIDARFFDYHRDLSADEIAHLLNGTIVWREDRKTQWAAVLSFDRLKAATP